MTRITFTHKGSRRRVDPSTDELEWSDRGWIAHDGPRTIGHNVGVQFVPRQGLLASYDGDQGQRKQSWVDDFVNEGLARTQDGLWVLAIETNKGIKADVVTDQTARAWLDQHAPGSDLTRHLS